ncbi:MAG: JAB domain-containing protein, partial [Acidobacteriota bacterium]
LGPQALSDVEILATILSDCRPEDDALIQAQELLDEPPGGLRGLLAFEGLPGELDRLGSARTAALLAAIELGRRLAKVAVPEQPLNDRDAIAAYIKTRYGKLDQEVLGVIFLTLDLRWIADREIFRGSLTRVTAEPRTILRHGLRLGAASFLLFHTHPSGSATPSDEDREFTLRMAACGEVIGIGLADHLVVDSTGRWQSAKPLKY